MKWGKAVCYLRMFRVYPEARSGLYAKVYIWPTKAAMWDAVCSVSNVGRTFAAICCPGRVVSYKRLKEGRTKQVFAQVHIPLKMLRMGVITHEAGHAALEWCRRKGVAVSEVETGENGMVTREEERFCYVLGNIARQIVLKTEGL